MSDKIILSDRIKELSRTTGTGPLTLDGAVRGFSAFGDFYSYGDAVFYAATDGTDYEVGSGQYILDGSTNKLTRFPFRSSDITAGPYYVNATSNAGATAGTAGYFYPLYINESSANAVPSATSAHEHTFTEIPGVTFYMPNNHTGHGGDLAAASASGNNYYNGDGVASGDPISFVEGIKEVYVTYPGKYSVFTGYGLEGLKEPRASGVAFWRSEQTLCYDDTIVWSPSEDRLGITQTNPQYAVDVGGTKVYSQVRASGFISGGSGILFSGFVPPVVAGSYSGGRQLEPFVRNEVDNTTGTDAVIALSGLVDQRLTFIKQPRGTVLAGPPSGCGGALGCADDYPTFRFLTSGDLPDLKYITQYNDANPNTDGAIALYKESGVAKYNNLFFYKEDTSTLAINTTNPHSSYVNYGDYNDNGIVDTADYGLVYDNMGGSPSVLNGKGGGGATVNWGDYLLWAKRYNRRSNDVSLNVNGSILASGSIVAEGDLIALSGASFLKEAVVMESVYIVGDCQVDGDFISTSPNTMHFVTLSGVSGTMQHLKFDDHQIRIGENAGGSGSKLGSDLGTYSTWIGSFAGSGASGCDGSNVIGTHAGVNASGSTYNNFIGPFAGHSATGVSYSNLIGSGAGTRSSGNYNTYIGANAGYHTSGNNNIEIVTSGSYPSILHSGEPTHNKLNIGSTLVGDTETKRIAIGFVSGVDLNPDSTLQILPSAVTDVGISIRSVIGHTADPFQVVSGDKTTVLMSVDPTGSILTSGTISASGGILLRLDTSTNITKIRNRIWRHTYP